MKRNVSKNFHKVHWGKELPVLLSVREALDARKQKGETFGSKEGFSR